MLSKGNPKHLEWETCKFFFPKASNGIWSFACSRSNGSEANQLGCAFRGAYQFYGTTGVAGNSNHGDELSPLWGELPPFPGEFLSLGRIPFPTANPRSVGPIAKINAQTNMLRSQRRKVLSHEPESAYCPSKDITTSETKCPCPWSDFNGFPVKTDPDSSNCHKMILSKI